MGRKVRTNRYINTKNRIDLTPEHYLKRVKTIWFLNFIAGALAAGASLYCLGITYTSLGLAIGILVTSVILNSYLVKYSKTVSILDDSLILNGMNKRSYVMSIRGIKTVKSKIFLGICFTSMRYNLDGKLKDVRFININPDISPEQRIKEILKERKKKKANHKPGSVLAHQA